MAKGNVFKDLTKQALKETGDAVMNSVKGNTRAMGGFAKNTLGAIEAAGVLQREGLSAAGKVFMTDKNTLNVGKIAASAATVGVAGRVLGGGGLYKDRNGKTNLAGIPFV